MQSKKGGMSGIHNKGQDYAPLPWSWVQDFGTFFSLPLQKLQDVIAGFRRAAGENFLKLQDVSAGFRTIFR